MRQAVLRAEARALAVRLEALKMAVMVRDHA